MKRTYNEGIDNAVHDTQIVLNRLLEELLRESLIGSESVIIIKNEFRDRIEIWSKFEKGGIEK